MKPHKFSTLTDITPIFEFSNLVNSLFDTRFILNSLLLTVMGKMAIPRGAVYIRSTKNDFILVAHKGVHGKTLPPTLNGFSLPKRIVKIGTASRSVREEVSEFSSLGFTSMMPISAGKKSCGLLVLGHRLSGTPFRQSELQLLTSLTNVAASAIEKAKVVERLDTANKRLDQKYQELNTLFDLSKEFSALSESDQVIRLLAFSLMGQIGVNRYAVLLQNNNTIEMPSSRLPGELKLDELASLFELRVPMTLQDIARRKSMARAVTLLSAKEIKVVVPMVSSNVTKGILLLGRKLQSPEYSASDLEFLYSLGNLAIISVENARLFKEAIEKQKMEDELVMAAEIQTGLLPRRIPDILGIEIAATSIASKQVGGDYYDIIERADGTYFIAIGDVSGKGMSAALMMASAQAALRTLAPLDIPLDEIVNRLNKLTFDNAVGGRFITFFLGKLDPKEKGFSFVNAGHNEPVVISSEGKVSRLTSGGLLLGVLPNVPPYKTGTLTLRLGDILCLFTDGVSEAMNKKEEEFTETALINILQSNRNLSAAEIVDRVLNSVQQHAEGVPQSDDITICLLAVR